MKSKVMFSGSEARDGLRAGVDKLYTAVASTLGPYGSSVIIENDGRKDNPPTVTKDGVSVARVVNWDNQLEQLGARIVLQASSQADTKSGDGTTTTVVLARALVDQAAELVQSGVLPIVVKKRLEKLSEDVVAYLQEYSLQFEVTDEVIEHVARISANGDTLLAAVALEAVRAANGGPVTVKPCRAEVDELETLDGSIITGTPINMDVVPRDDSVHVFREPRVIVYGNRITTEHLQVLTKGREDNTMIVFVSGARDGVDEWVSDWNGINTAGKLIIAETPGAGPTRRRYAQILATMADTEVTEHTKDIHIGKLDEFTVSERNMCIFTKVDVSPTVSKLIEQRDNEVRGSQRYKHLDTTLRFVLGRRVTIFVGGLTDADTKERKDRMVDAVSAIECAKDGVIPGGGTVLAYASFSYNDKVLGKALALPMIKIYMNGGLSYEEASQIVEAEYIDSKREGRTHLRFFDMLEGCQVDLLSDEYRVYDPVRVTINAIRAACAVAGTVITSNCCLVEDRNGHF